MKLKDGFVLTDVGENKVAVPVGERAKDIKGIIRMNDTAVFIWNCLAEGLEKEEIADRMLKEYDGLDHETAICSVGEMIEKMKKDGLMED